MSKKKFTGSVNGKGYYIALVLCAVAIGVSGFLYYRNVEKPDVSADGQTVTNPQEDTPVVATNPDGTPANNPNSVQVSLKTGWPLQGQTVAVYAMDSLIYNQTTRDWRVHNGIDIAAEAGSQVRAAAAGEVYSVYEDEAMGMTVVIRHQQGYSTRYASLDAQVPVKAGDQVTMGQVIGKVGNTALMESAIGDHLHFGVTCNGEPVNPNEFLKQE